MKRYPPEPPYHWQPLGTQHKGLPEPGDVFAWRHEAWRVTEVNPVPEVDWTEEDRRRMGSYLPEFRDPLAPRYVIALPARLAASEDPADRDNAVHLRTRAARSSFDVYPSGHYPVCSECGEPSPCRAEMARQITDQELKVADRFALPGVCPACQKAVTARQRGVTFEENLRVPFGPPVTFHRRAKCLWSARRYEQEWAQAAPGRMTELTCPGDRHDHADGSECSEGPLCAGLKLPHRTFAQCWRNRDGRWRSAGMEGACGRCEDAEALREAGLAERQAAGDWTAF